ncbi:MAG TPA: MarR family transcriptional regulator [Longimicrobiales bacterium]|nr:MarR family transcriptional regulator [Longimicrobiales bacterium]
MPAALAANANAPGHADALAFHRALTELVRVYQFRDRARICCHDISVTQCYALEALVLRGPLTLNELSAELYLDKSTTSRVADGLERKGYAARSPHPASRRSVLLEATRSGRDLHARIEAEIVAEEDRLLAEFSPEVRASATRLIEALARAAAARVDTTGGSCCRIDPPVQLEPRSGASR